MANSYIPSRQADLLAWALNFSTKITAAPGTYGLLVGDATAIAAVFNTFNTALTAATNPATRTASTVATKDVAKAAMLSVMRPYAVRISLNAAVTPAAKIDVGVTVRDTEPSPIPVPSTQPLINIVAATPLAHRLRFSDVTTPDKRAKPFGAIGLELFGKVVTAGPVTPDDAVSMGVFTRQPFTVNFAAADVGKTCVYFARWINGKGQTGPWSLAAQMTVAG